MLLLFIVVSNRRCVNPLGGKMKHQRKPVAFIKGSKTARRVDISRYEKEKRKRLSYNITFLLKGVDKVYIYIFLWLFKRFLFPFVNVKIFSKIKT